MTAEIAKMAIPTNAPTYGRPDWVLLGVPNGDGSVTVFGSLEMSEAELRAERDFYDDYWSNPYVRAVPLPSMRYSMRAEMKTFAMAQGPTYASALSALFGYWDADAQRDGPKMSALLERNDEMSDSCP